MFHQAQMMKPIAQRALLGAIKDYSQTLKPNGAWLDLIITRASDNLRDTMR